MPPPYPRPNPARSPATLRPLSAELSPLSRSDGSASLKVGNTHVLCAVHGPVAPRVSRRERPDGATVSVAFSRGLMAHAAGTGSANGASLDENVVEDGTTTTTTTSSSAAGGGGGAKGRHSTSTTAPPPIASSSSMKTVPVPPPPGLGATERELEHFLRDALSSCVLLDQYPRCVIQVVVQVVQSDGCVLGSALNCAALALMDAGVAMAGLPVASTCVVVPGDEDGESTIWLDPTAEEEAGEGHAIAVHVTDMAQPPNGADEGYDGEIIASLTFGAPLSLKGLLSSIESTRRSGAATVAFMRLAVEQKVQREVQTLWS
mmetsp:Transcript_16576/g.36011  ORF Transcript_16576/g.36011 Transcript_16576/m.36011 type:complete len:318 (+) Transcript_16576:47-1000(+)